MPYSNSKFSSDFFSACNQNGNNLSFIHGKRNVDIHGYIKSGKKPKRSEQFVIMHYLQTIPQDYYSMFTHVFKFT